MGIATVIGNIVEASIIKLDVEVEQGSMIAAQLEATGDWALLFERGSDWECFEDSERNSAESWQPTAIREALAELGDRFPADEAEWYSDWAADAESLGIEFE